MSNGYIIIMSRGCQKYFFVFITGCLLLLSLNITAQGLEPNFSKLLGENCTIVDSIKIGPDNYKIRFKFNGESIEGIGKVDGEKRFLVFNLEKFKFNEIFTEFETLTNTVVPKNTFFIISNVNQTISSEALPKRFSLTRIKDGKKVAVPLKLEEGINWVSQLNARALGIPDDITSSDFQGIMQANVGTEISTYLAKGDKPTDEWFKNLVLHVTLYNLIDNSDELSVQPLNLEFTLAENTLKASVKSLIAFENTVDWIPLESLEMPIEGVWEYSPEGIPSFSLKGEQKVSGEDVYKNQFPGLNLKNLGLELSLGNNIGNSGHLLSFGDLTFDMNVSFDWEGVDFSQVSIKKDKKGNYYPVFASVDFGKLNIGLPDNGFIKELLKDVQISNLGLGKDFFEGNISWNGKNIQIVGFKMPGDVSYNYAFNIPNINLSDFGEGSDLQITLPDLQLPGNNQLSFYIPEVNFNRSIKDRKNKNNKGFSIPSLEMISSPAFTSFFNKSVSFPKEGFSLSYGTTLPHLDLSLVKIFDGQFGDLGLYDALDGIKIDHLNFTGSSVTVNFPVFEGMDIDMTAFKVPGMAKPVFLFNVPEITLNNYISGLGGTSLPELPTFDNVNLFAIPKANLDSLGVWNIDGIDFPQNISLNFPEFSFGKSDIKSKNKKPFSFKPGINISFPMPSFPGKLGELPILKGDMPNMTGMISVDMLKNWKSWNSKSKQGKKPKKSSPPAPVVAFEAGDEPPVDFEVPIPGFEVGDLTMSEGVLKISGVSFDISPVFEDPKKVLEVGDLALTLEGSGKLNLNGSVVNLDDLKLFLDNDRNLVFAHWGAAAGSDDKIKSSLLPESLIAADKLTLSNIGIEGWFEKSESANWSLSLSGEGALALHETINAKVNTTIQKIDGEFRKELSLDLDNSISLADFNVLPIPTELAALESIKIYDIKIAEDYIYLDFTEDDTKDYLIAFKVAGQSKYNFAIRSESALSTLLETLPEEVTTITEGMEQEVITFIPSTNQKLSLDISGYPDPIKEHFQKDKIDLVPGLTVSALYTGKYEIGDFELLNLEKYPLSLTLNADKTYKVKFPVINIGKLAGAFPDAELFGNLFKNPDLKLYDVTLGAYVFDGRVAVKGYDLEFVGFKRPGIDTKFNFAFKFPELRVDDFINPAADIHFPEINIDHEILSFYIPKANLFGSAGSKGNEGTTDKTEADDNSTNQSSGGMFHLPSLEMINSPRFASFFSKSAPFPKDGFELSYGLSFEHFDLPLRTLFGDNFAELNAYIGDVRVGELNITMHSVTCSIPLMEGLEVDLTAFKVEGMKKLNFLFNIPEFDLQNYLSDLGATAFNEIGTFENVKLMAIPKANFGDLPTVSFAGLPLPPKVKLAFPELNTGSGTTSTSSGNAEGDNEDKENSASSSKGLSFNPGINFSAPVPEFSGNIKKLLDLIGNPSLPSVRGQLSPKILRNWKSWNLKHTSSHRITGSTREDGIAPTVKFDRRETEMDYTIPLPSFSINDVHFDNSELEIGAVDFSLDKLFEGEPQKLVDAGAIKVSINGDVKIQYDEDHSVSLKNAHLLYDKGDNLYRVGWSLEAHEEVAQKEKGKVVKEIIPGDLFDMGVMSIKTLGVDAWFEKAADTHIAFDFFGEALVNKGQENEHDVEFAIELERINGELHHYMDFKSRHGFSMEELSHANLPAVFDELAEITIHEVTLADDYFMINFGEDNAGNITDLLVGFATKDKNQIFGIRSEILKNTILKGLPAGMHLDHIKDPMFIRAPTEADNYKLNLKEAAGPVKQFFSYKDKITIPGGLSLRTTYSGDLIINSHKFVTVKNMPLNLTMGSNPEGSVFDGMQVTLELPDFHYYGFDLSESEIVFSRNSSNWNYEVHSNAAFTYDEKAFELDVIMTKYDSAATTEDHKKGLLVKSKGNFNWKLDAFIDDVSLNDISLTADIDQVHEETHLTLDGNLKIKNNSWNAASSITYKNEEFSNMLIAVKGSEINLNDLPGISQLTNVGEGAFSLPSISLKNPVLSHNYLSGDITINDKTTRAVVFKGAESDGGWGMVFKLPNINLGNLLSLDNAVLNTISFPETTWALGTGDMKISLADIPTEAANFIKPYFSAQNAKLSINKGFTLFAHANIAAGLGESEALKPAASILSGIGLDKEYAFTGGVGASSFTLSAIPDKIEVDNSSKLGFLEDVESPSVFFSYNNNQLQFGLQADVHVTVGNEKLDFHVSTGVSSGSDGASLLFDGAMDGNWYNPMGLTGLEFEDVSLGINGSFESFDLNFGGKIILDDHHYSFAAAVPATGNISKFALCLNADEISMMDFAALADKMAGGAIHPEKLPLDILKFQNVDIVFLPLGSSIAGKCQIDGMDAKTGIFVQGDALLDNKALGSLKASAGFDGLSMDTKLATTDFGFMSIDDAELDIKVKKDDQHFKIDGQTSLLGTEEKVNLTLEKEKVQFDMDVDVPELFTAHAKLSTKGGINFSPDNELFMEFSVKNIDPLHALTALTEQLSASLNELNDKIEEAKKSLQEKQKALGELDKEYNEKYKEIKKSRDKTIKKLDDALAKVNQIKKKIDKKKKRYRELKKDRDNCAWHDTSCSATWDEAHMLEIDIEIAALWTAKHTADAVLKSIKSATEFMPIEMAPSLVYISGKKVTAKAALITAEEALSLSQAVNNGIIKVSDAISDSDFLNNALKIKELKVSGTLAAKSASANKLNVDMDAVIFKNGIKQSFEVNPDDLANLGKAIKKEVKKEINHLADVASQVVGINPNGNPSLDELKRNTKKYIETNGAIASKADEAEMFGDMQYLNQEEYLFDWKEAVVPKGYTVRDIKSGKKDEVFAVIGKGDAKVKIIRFVPPIFQDHESLPFKSKYLALNDEIDVSPNNVIYASDKNVERTIWKLTEKDGILVHEKQNPVLTSAEKVIVDNEGHLFYMEASSHRLVDVRKSGFNMTKMKFVPFYQTKEIRDITYRKKNDEIWLLGTNSWIYRRHKGKNKVYLKVSQDQIKLKDITFDNNKDMVWVTADNGNIFYIENKGGHKTWHRANGNAKAVAFTKNFIYALTPEGKVMYSYLPYSDRKPHKNELQLNQIMLRGDQLISENEEYNLVIDEHGDLTLGKAGAPFEERKVLKHKQNLSYMTTSEKYGIRMYNMEGTFKGRITGQNRNYTDEQNKFTQGHYLRVMNDGRLVYLNRYREVVQTDDRSINNKIPDRLWKGIVRSGFTLYRGERFRSENRAWTFYLREDGMFGVYKEGETAPRSVIVDPKYGADYLHFENGILKAYSKDGYVVWSTKPPQTKDKKSEYYLHLDNEGDIQITNGSNVVWENGLVLPFKYKLSLHDNLTRGSYLISPNRKYMLLMKTDGNLVIINRKTKKEVWDANIADKNPIKIVMQEDGLLAALDKDHKVVWSTPSSKGTVKPYAKLENSGRLAIRPGGKDEVTWISYKPRE
jgi:hypothetical protein